MEGGRSHHYNFDTPNGPYHMGFYEGNHGPSHIGVAFTGPTSMFGISGGHPDSAKIFSTIHAILRHHMQNNPQVQRLHFSAEDKSHRKLYDALVRRFAPTARIKRHAFGAQYEIKRQDVAEPLD